MAAASKASPDTGLLSFQEVLQASESIVNATKYHYPGAEPRSTPLSVICDADTGYGNEMNVRRTIKSFINIGVEGVMIEDQLAPKRCGHARDKRVVDFETATRRVRAAVEAREEEKGKDLVIIARTDARAIHGIEEALRRAREFVRLGADITFVEAPQSEEELRVVGAAEGTGWKMANMLSGGKTPEKTVGELGEMGFNLAAYPFDLLLPSMLAVKGALDDLWAGKRRKFTKDEIAFLWDNVGFTRYERDEKRVYYSQQQ